MYTITVTVHEHYEHYVCRAELWFNLSVPGEAELVSSTPQYRIPKNGRPDDRFASILTATDAFVGFLNVQDDGASAAISVQLP